MAIQLFFDLAQTLRLAEHAATCTEHAPSVGEHMDGRACPGGLEWVKDADGAYLMSTGSPALLSDRSNPRSNVVVYAEGWGPGTRAELGRTEVGRDDFAEHFHLGERPDPDGPTFLDGLRGAVASGGRWFVLTVTAEQVSYHVSKEDPEAADA